MVVVLLSVPHAAPAHPVPDIAQVTPLLFGSFETVAVTCCVPPAFTVAVDGPTETAIAGGAALLLHPPTTNPRKSTANNSFFIYVFSSESKMYPALPTNPGTHPSRKPLQSLRSSR